MEKLDKLVGVKMSSTMYEKLLELAGSNRQMGKCIRTFIEDGLLFSESRTTGGVKEQIEIMERQPVLGDRRTLHRDRRIELHEPVLINLTPKDAGPQEA